jgi:hypothetical protein
MGWRNFSKTVEKKFLQPTCSGCISPSIRLFIRSSVCLFVCLSVIYENTLNFHVGIKIRVSTWSFLSVVHPLRISNTYSYVREESLGSTRKSQMVDTRNLKIVVPPAHAQQVWLPSPHRINFSVCLSVRLFVCSSVIYENTLNFHVGIKIRVSTWSFLSVLHPLRIPIPMYEKKVRVQQENL